MNNSQEPHGICLVNKPSGITSHDVVNRARKIFETKSIGHTGTLDPLASGLLILTVGDANKLSDYIMDSEKGYDVQIKLGVTTNTYDRTGEVTSQFDPSALTPEKISQEIKRLQGEIELEVPSFSAVKVGGKKLYELARKKLDVPSVIREMSFRDIEILDITNPFVHLKFKCSKGAYVRSWVHQLGQNLGVGATMWELIRDYNAPYTLAQAKDLDGVTKEDLLSSKAFVPISMVLPHWPRLEVNEKEFRLLKNGCLANSLEKRSLVAIQADQKLPDGLFIVDSASGAVLSFLTVLSPYKVAIKKVFIRD